MDKKNVVFTKKDLDFKSNLGIGKIRYDNMDEKNISKIYTSVEANRDFTNELQVELLLT